MRMIMIVCLGIVMAGCGDSEIKETVRAGESADTLHNVPGKAEKKIVIAPARINTAQLPAGIKFKGNLQEAWQWSDALGTNILITSQVPEYPDKRRDDMSDDAYTAELHAFHFLKKDTAYRLLWKISDAERSCPFDITARFLKNATTITDLDSNGIAETTIQYTIACRSDVSPAFMKLIMHEDTAKYSLRGMTCEAGNPEVGNCVTANDLNLEKKSPAKDEWEEHMRKAGRYQSEKEFLYAPPAFIVYARQQWLKYISND